MIRICIVLGLMITLVSCQKNSSSEVSTTLNLADKSWTIIKKQQYLNDITYTASLVPVDYFIENHKEAVPVDFDRATEKIVLLEFQHDDGVDLLLKAHTDRDYQSSVAYMSFDIQKDLSLKLSSGQTVTCDGVLFERNFKVAPFKRIMVFFQDDGIDKSESIQLIYNDNLFGNGIIKFNLDSSPIPLQ